jgi:hypothetical protein
MNKHMNKLALVLTSQVMGGILFAQTPANVSATSVAQVSSQVTAQSMPQIQTSTTTASTVQKAGLPLSLSLGIEYAQKVAVEEGGERESTTDITIAPSYKINSILTAAGNIVFSKENSGARQSSVSNTTVNLGIKGIKISESLETLHSVGGVIPTNEDSIKRDRLKGAAVLTNGLRWTNPFAKIEYKLGLSKNFHEFTENAEGSANVEYRLTNSLNVVVPLTDKFSISALGIYRLGRTYKGFQRNAFEIHSDLNYDILEKLAINIGTSNDGSALKANGVDSNIEAYNENTSIIRAGLTLTL